MDERREVERDEPVVERERTTIINTGGERGGGGGTLVAVLLLAVLAVVAFLVFGRGLMSGDTDVNIDVKAPDIDLPKVDPPSNPAPAPSK